MQAFFRILVILLALGGTTGAAVAAVLAQGELESAERVVSSQLGVNSIEEVTKLSEKRMYARFAQANSADLDNCDLELERYNRVKWGIWFLYATAGLGLLGTFLIMFEQGLSAAILLLIAVIGPALILPQGLVLYLLLFTGVLPLAGLLAFFVRPKPRRFLATAEA